MVRQWQDMIYDGHRADSATSDPMAVKPAGEADIYPDFVTIAAGYRVRAERVTRPDELEAAYARMLEDPAEPWLLDVIVEAEANVYPMIPAGGSYMDIIMSDEDLKHVSRSKQGSNL
jgi:acetolactate synthase-1/2/3 large subunit